MLHTPKIIRNSLSA